MTSLVQTTIYHYIHDIMHGFQVKLRRPEHIYVEVFIFFIPCIILTLPPSSNSDPGSHSGPFSPLPTTVHASVFYREKNSAFSFLVDSRRYMYICIYTMPGVACTTSAQQHLRKLALVLFTHNVPRAHTIFEQKRKRHYNSLEIEHFVEIRLCKLGTILQLVLTSSWGRMKNRSFSDFSSDDSRTTGRPRNNQYQVVRTPGPYF